MGLAHCVGLAGFAVEGMGLSDEQTRALVAALARIDILMAAQAKHASSIANARRCLYLAYLAEGFTEAEALELCKALSLS